MFSLCALGHFQAGWEFFGIASDPEYWVTRFNQKFISTLLCLPLNPASYTTLTACCCHYRALLWFWTLSWKVNLQPSLNSWELWNFVVVIGDIFSFYPTQLLSLSDPALKNTPEYDSATTMLPCSEGYWQRMSNASFPPSSIFRPKLSTDHSFILSSDWL